MKRKLNLNKLSEDAQRFSDAYQYERAAHWGVTQKVIWQVLRATSVTYKKALHCVSCMREQDLIPRHPKTSVIVMDNATFHKRQDTQQGIKQAGHILEYLPPYSLELNPIEPQWTQAKAIYQVT